MYPILFQLGSLRIPSWHVFFVVAVISIYQLTLQSNHYLKCPIPDSVMRSCFILAYTSGYLGSRLLELIATPRSYLGFTDFLKEWFSPGGMVFYGGFIGSTLTVALFLSVKKISLRLASDICLPNIFFGLAIGRIGCFLNGDDFGSIVTYTGDTAPWWAVYFPDTVDNAPRYPVQLFEAGLSLAIFIIGKLLINLQIEHLPRGIIGSLSLILYSICRYFLEKLRGDERGWIISPHATTSQTISIILMFLSILFTAYCFFIKDQTISTSKSPSST